MKESVQEGTINDTALLLAAAAAAYNDHTSEQIGGAKWTMICKCYR